MTDILIAFIFGAFTGACLLVAVSCIVVRRDCDVANEMADELNREEIDGIKRTDRKNLGTI